MSSTQTRSDTAAQTRKAPTVDMKLEVVVIPVADVDRAKRFYGDLGWRLDADFVVGNEFRGVQFTPPGSPCSIHFGKGVTSAAPGSATRTLSGRDRHRGRARRAHRSRRRRERSVPPRRSGKAAGQRPGSGATQLLVVRHVQRSGRQQLAVAGGHGAIARTRRRGRHDIHLVDRARERAPPCGGCARRAREADRPARRGLAELVRRVHGRGAGR